MNSEEINAGSMIQQSVMPKLVDYSQVLQLTDTGELIDFVEHALRLESYNPITGQWGRPEEVQPLMNDLGIRMMISKLQTIVNRHMGTGMFPKDMKMYNKIIAGISRMINNEIFKNSERYALHHAYQEYVKSLMLDPIKIFLTKPINDSERDHIHGQNKSFNFQKFFQPKDRKANFMYE